MITEQHIPKFGFFLCLTAASFIQANGDSAPKPHQSVNAEAIIQEGAAGSFANVDLGEIDSSTEFSINIKLLNATDRSFEFSDIKSTCACTNLQLQSSKLNPLDSVNLFGNLRTPKSSSSDRISVAATLRSSKENQGVRVILRYRLKGMLSFRGAMFSSHADHDDRTITGRIPILFTHPVESKNIEVQFKPDLEFMSSKITDSTDGQFLEFECPVESLPDSGITMRAMIRDVKNERNAECALLLARTPAIEITPSLIRFNPLSQQDPKEDQPDVLSAKCLLKVNSADPKQSAPAAPETQKRVFVESTIDGKSISTKVMSIGNNIYRIHASLPNKLANEWTKTSGPIVKEINWVIHTSEGKQTITTRAAINSLARLQMN